MIFFLIGINNGKEVWSWLKEMRIFMGLFGTYNFHFTVSPESYMQQTNWRLCKTAVPNLLPAFPVQMSLENIAPEGIGEERMAGPSTIPQLTVSVPTQPIQGQLEQRALATATFIQQVDELFDSFNGSRLTPIEGKELKCCVTANSPHIEYWREAFHKVKSWNFRRVTKTGQLRKLKPPSQIGWMISLNAIPKIWDYLQGKNIPSLRPRSLNQDPLENLFGSIRAGCGCSDNPTTAQFVGSLKTQILNNLTQQALSGTNCQEDDGTLLCNLKAFLSTGDRSTQLAEDSDMALMGVAPLSLATENAVDDAALVNDVAVGSTGTLSVAYVSGFIAKRLTSVNCASCKELLCGSPHEPQNLFITFKEWSEQHSKLTYPSENLVLAVGKAITILEDALPQLRGTPKVGELAANEISKNLDATILFCQIHQRNLEMLVKGVYRIGIPWWCKRKNADFKTDKKLQKSTKKTAKQKKVAKFRHH